MDVTTFEKYLHSNSEWHQSIEQARIILKYDPEWSWDQRRKWDDEGVQFPNLMRLTSIAEQTIEAIGYPGQVTLQLYWMACFYNDYKFLGIEEIKLWLSHWACPKRVYPYIEWHIDYDKKNKVINLKIPDYLPLGEIAKLPDIKAFLMGKRKGEVSSDIHKAKVRGDVFKPSKEVQSQIRRAAIGELNYMEALREEYGREIIRKKEDINSASNKYSKLIKLQSLRKKVRERVRSRFKRAGLPIESRKIDWWIEIEMNNL